MLDCNFFFTAGFPTTINGITPPPISRITNGLPTNYPLPYQLLIYNHYRFVANRTYAIGSQCGGTLIGKKYALSALHCFTLYNSTIQIDVDLSQVVAGIYQIDRGWEQVSFN